MTVLLACECMLTFFGACLYIYTVLLGVRKSLLPGRQAASDGACLLLPTHTHSLFCLSFRTSFVGSYPTLPLITTPLSR